LAPSESGSFCRAVAVAVEPDVVAERRELGGDQAEVVVGILLAGVEHGHRRAGGRRIAVGVGGVAARVRRGEDVGRRRRDADEVAPRREAREGVPAGSAAGAVGGHRRGERHVVERAGDPVNTGQQQERTGTPLRPVGPSSCWPLALSSTHTKSPRRRRRRRPMLMPDLLRLRRQRTQAVGTVGLVGEAVEGRLAGGHAARGDHQEVEARAKSKGCTTRLPNSILYERTLVIGTGGTVVQFGASQLLVGPTHLAAAGIAALSSSRAWSRPAG
jgi:hypothetical protein